MPQSYVRDLAITAVICFTGGVGLTLLVVLIYYRVSQRKKQRERDQLKEEEERNTTLSSNHISHLDRHVKRDVFLQTSGNQQFEGKAMMLDTRVENHSGHFRPRMEEDSSHFRCSECVVKQQMRWNNGINRVMEVEDETERMKMRIVKEEEKRKPRTHKGILSMNIPDKFLSLGNSNAVSYPMRETFDERPEILPAYRTDRVNDSFRTERKNNGYETLHCESCHRTYRPPEQTMRPGRNHTNMRDSTIFDSFPPQHRMTDKERSIYHKQLEMMMNREFRRASRNVTFDLEGLRNLEQGHIQGEDREEKLRSPRDKEKGRKKRQLKVKLNLNPLRKSKVHPKRKNEQGHSSKKSKENRRDGKEREEKGGKTKSSKKTKESNEKTKKSTQATDASDIEKRKEEDNKDRKSATSSKQETTSKSEQGGQEEKADCQEENTNPGNSQPGDSANSADQQTLSTVTGQGHNVEAGIVLRSAQLSSQFPGKNHAANLSLLGSTASRLTGSALSVHGGNMLLNTMASGSQSVASGIAISGPNLASRGGLGGIGGQTGVGIMSPATSLLANAVHANVLQASGMQNAPLSTNLAANPGINPPPSNQSLSHIQLPPDSSPVVARQMFDPAQGPGLQRREEPQQPPPESQAKDSIPIQAQASQSTEGLSGATQQAQGLVTPVENLSANNGQTEKVPDGSLLNGGNGVPAVGDSGDSKELTNVAVSGVSVPGMSTQSGPSTGGADGTTALLQQEYVSEEGGSSPRRKLRLVLPEKTSSRPPTALEKKIR